MKNIIVPILLLRLAQFTGLAILACGVAGLSPLLSDNGEFAKRFVLFSGPCYVGLSMILGAQWILRRLVRMSHRERTHPDQPWMWAEDWAERRIRLNNKPAAFITGFFVGLYLLVLVPLGIVLASVKNGALVYSFLAVAGFVLWAIARWMWRNRHWNRSELQLDTLPGVVGGEFRATATLPFELPNETALKVRLRCEEASQLHEEQHRRENKQSSQTMSVILWDEEQVAVTCSAMAGTQQTLVPVQFQIPGDCSPTSSSGRKTVTWFLTIGLKGDADVREAAFVVPIFRIDP